MFEEITQVNQWPQSPDVIWTIQFEFECLFRLENQCKPTTQNKFVLVGEMQCCGDYQELKCLFLCEACSITSFMTGKVQSSTVHTLAFLTGEIRLSHFNTEVY